MEHLYESIEHDEKLPIKIFTQTIDDFPFHWHQDTEFLFVLRGSIEINIDNQITTLKEGQIFIVNKNEYHFIHSLDSKKKAQLLVLQFNMDYFNKFNLNADDLKFSIKYFKEDGNRQNAYNRIRGLLASLMRSVINKEVPLNLIIERHLLDLIIILINNFKISDKLQEEIQKEERTVEILRYINKNCINPDLGLEMIADEFHLNYQYLSRYFKDKIGISIKKFIDNTRLNRSLQALKSTDERILDIALGYGFADAKAYYRVFKDVMDNTPAGYRDKYKVDIKIDRPTDYFSINSKDTLSKLFTYLPKHFNNQVEEKNINSTDTIYLNKDRTSFDHSFKKIITFGYAPHGLRADLLSQLKTIQNDVGFEYVRFHGIFADELLLFNENSSGDVYYNFNHIDNLLDNLLSIGLKPFLELGFMPTQLASTDKTIFWWKSSISPPNDINKWTTMIDAFIRHLINRYGINEVSTWFFEFWNEPEFEGIFWDGDIKQFYSFFKATYRAIKKVDNRLLVGGFGNLPMEISKQWLKDYAELSKRDGIILDFFTFHIYQVSVDDIIKEVKVNPLLQNINFDSSAGVIKYDEIGAVLGDQDFLNTSIIEITGVVDNLNISKPDYYITEWNANTDCRDLVHDTCYMASFILKNVIDNYGLVKGMGFWTVSDIFEEFKLEQPLFHGGFGLMTYNGLKKASYHAYNFLSSLGDKLIYRSDGVIVTAKGDDYQIIFYNYVHYNDLYSRFDYSQISATDRYNVFRDVSSKTLRLVLNGLSGRFQLEQQKVNRLYGSSYDAWVNIGAPNNLSEKAYTYLKNISEPLFKTWQVNSSRELSLDFHLDPHEIQLITLKKIY